MAGSMVGLYWKMALPSAMTDEIVKQYSDVLRVGRVMVNGSEVCWSTSGSTRSQLDAFSVAFCGILRKLPELQDMEDDIISQAAYWFCKAVSINYVLCEVLRVVKQNVGMDCSINTACNAGRGLEYSVDVQSNHVMRVALSWKEKGNIVHYDPELSRKTVKGTLSSLATEFPMPLNSCFCPVYSLQMALRGAFKRRVISNFACISKDMTRMMRRQSGTNVFVDTPLHCQGQLDEDASNTEAPSSITSEISMDSLLSWDDC